MEKWKKIEEAGIKFFCKKEELKNALEKHCGFKRVEFKKPRDVVLAVKALLAAKELIFVDVDGEGCDDDHSSSQDIRIALTSVSPSTYTLDKYGANNEDDKEKFLLNKFLEGARELQKMIFGEKDK